MGGVGRLNDRLGASQAELDSLRHNVQQAESRSGSHGAASPSEHHDERIESHSKIDSHGDVVDSLSERIDSHAIKIGADQADRAVKSGEFVVVDLPDLRTGSQSGLDSQNSGEFAGTPSSFTMHWFQLRLHASWVTKVLMCMWKV